MKTQHPKLVRFNNRRRGAVMLLSFVCLSLMVLTPGAAQLRTQRRVTAIQLGGAAEGSRVTVVSDSAVSDYEAFRRGDRFYLKLPLAEFASGAPHFRADGFEDVQVQTTGDGLIVSFKLQPGATARVEQHGNRLDVVFTSPNRIASSTSNSTRNSANSGTGRDGAGPTPTEDASAYRERFVSARPGSGNGDRWRRNSRSQATPKTDVSKNSNANKNSNSTGNKQPTPIIASAASPSPLRSPAPLSSPGIAMVNQPTTLASPAVSASPQPLAGSTNPISSRNAGDTQSVRQWISSNRLATFLGALILLSLIAYLLMAIRSRREDGSKTRLAKTPKVQPRNSGDELSNLDDRMDKQSGSESVAQKPLSKAAAAGTPADSDPWVLTMPTIVTPAVAPDEHSEKEEDREVFEL